MNQNFHWTKNYFLNQFCFELVCKLEISADEIRPFYTNQIAALSRIKRGGSVL